MSLSESLSESRSVPLSLLPPPSPSTFPPSSSLLPSSALLPSSSLPSSSPQPTPLSPALIALALDFICPPSQLSSPLPPHFVSSSLLQRHHFLQISPDNPASYLAWPSDSDSPPSAIRLLETFQKPIDDRLYSTFPVCYSADAESTYAHVAISPDHTPGLRLVFQWNSPDGWKYHNIALMPFPPNTFDTVKDALLFQPRDFLAEPTMNIVNDEDDSYWDAYGADDSDNPALLTVTKDKSQVGTEDAYWAQYAEVHGSGDSTLPSPRPLKQKHESPERIIVAYTGLNPSSVYNPLEPPSPNTLARRLEDLSPRLPSPLLDDDSDSASASNSLTTPPAVLSTQVTSASSGLSPPHLHEYVTDASAAPQHAGVTRSTESFEALKETIRGVYRLWKSGRPSCPLPGRDEREEFLDIVRQVMAEDLLP